MMNFTAIITKFKSVLAGHPVAIGAAAGAVVIGVLLRVTGLDMKLMKSQGKAFSAYGGWSQEVAAHQTAKRLQKATAKKQRSQEKLERQLAELQKAA